jgi:hypothetical protein
MIDCRTKEQVGHGVCVKQVGARSVGNLNVLRVRIHWKTERQAQREGHAPHVLVALVESDPSRIEHVLRPLLDSPVFLRFAGLHGQNDYPVWSAV